MWISKRKYNELIKDLEDWKNFCLSKGRRLLYQEELIEAYREENAELREKLAALAKTYHIELVLETGKRIETSITSTKGEEHVIQLVVDTFLRNNKDFSRNDIARIFLTEVTK